MIFFNSSALKLEKLNLKLHLQFIRVFRKEELGFQSIVFESSRRKGGSVQPNSMKLPVTIFINHKSDSILRTEKLLEEIDELKQANQFNQSQLHSLKQFIDSVGGSGYNSLQDISSNKKQIICKRLGINQDEIHVLFYDICIILFELIQFSNERSNYQIKQFLDSDTYCLPVSVNELAREAISSLHVGVNNRQFYKELCSIDKNLGQDFDQDVYQIFSQINKLGESNFKQSKQYFTQLMELKFIIAHTFEKRSQICAKLQQKINEAISIGSQFSSKGNDKSVVGSFQDIESDSILVMAVLNEKLLQINEKYNRQQTYETLQNKVQDECAHIKNTLKIFDLVNVTNISPQVISQANTYILQLVEIIIKMQKRNQGVCKSESEMLLELCGYQMALNILSDDIYIK